MLVLSRRLNQKILLPSINASVEVVGETVRDRGHGRDDGGRRAREDRPRDGTRHCDAAREGQPTRALQCGGGAIVRRIDDVDAGVGALAAVAGGAGGGGAGALTDARGGGGGGIIGGGITGYVTLVLTSSLSSLMAGGEEMSTSNVFEKGSHPTFANAPSEPESASR